VEFALVLPVFLLVLCGILDFGFLLYGRMTVINAAREGARAAVTVPTPTTATLQAAAQGAATNVASGIGPLTVTIACVPQPSKTCAWNSAQADSVSVTVSYTYRAFFPLLFGTTIPMASTVQMVLE
jgi:Flp pilus assembly protein TadG